MKKYLLLGCLVVFVATMTFSNVVRAETAVTTSATNISALLEQLQTLMKQVETLQKQLSALKGEIRDELKDGLKEGMEDEDIKKIQELLATDPTIYPKGIASGYFGPLTKEAIMRFQERHELTVTGVIDQETKDLLGEYFKERENGKFPIGLLRAPGISKKMLERWKERDGERYLDCDSKKAAGPLCKEDKKDDVANVTLSTSTVAKALTDAEDAIEDLQNLTEATTSTSITSTLRDAKRSLTEAKSLLTSANKYLDANKLKSAYEKAVQAKKVANTAIDKYEAKVGKYSNDDKEEDGDDDDEEEDDSEDDN